MKEVTKEILIILKISIYSVCLDTKFTGEDKNKQLVTIRNDQHKLYEVSVCDDKGKRKSTN